MDKYIYEINGTGCFCINLSKICPKKDKFNYTYNKTGGEDKEYFLRLKRSGHKILTSKFESYEQYCGFRITKEWALKRYFRIGYTDTIILIKQYLPSNLEKFILKTFTTIYLWLLLLIKQIFTSNKRTHIEFKIERQKGKLAAFFEIKNEFY